MNNRFLTSFLSVLFAAVPLLDGFSGTHHLYWNKNVESGQFSDPNMWLQTDGGAVSSDFDKGNERLFRISSKSSGTNTVILTDYNMLGASSYYLWGNGVLVLDGKNAVFTHHSPAPGNDEINITGQPSFSARDGNYNYPVFSLDKTAEFSFSNSLQSFARSVEESSLYWRLSRGRFSFADPIGTNALQTVTLASGGSTPREFFQADFDGVETIFPNLCVTCFYTNSCISVNGGTMFVNGAFEYAAVKRTYAGTNDFVVSNGAQVTVSGLAQIGCSDNIDTCRARVKVTGAGTKLTFADTSELSIAGDSRLCIEDSAFFSYLASKSISLKGVSRLEVGGEGTVADFATSNSLDLYDSSEVVFSGGSVSTLPPMSFIGYNAGTAAAKMRVRDNGTEVRVPLKSNNDQSLRIGEAAGNVGVVDLDGGRICPADKSFMCRIGVADGSKGILNVSGGTIDVGTTVAADFCIGMCGDGEVNLTGGEIISDHQVRFGHYANMSSVRTSVFNQTGGRLLVTGSDGSGMVLNNTGDSANRKSIVRLYGGTTEVYRVYGEKTKAQGFLGHAEVIADGGLLVPVRKTFTEATPFISGIDRFAIGAKGLVIDTRSFDTLVKQPMVDNEGVEGLLIKKGASTLLLAGGGYEVSKTRVDEGTLLVTNETAALATELIVNEGAAFSLAGTAKTAKLSSLTVDGGVIKLDPGDKITVDGSVSLKDVHFSFTSLPPLNSDALDVIECAGRLDDASAKALKRALVENVAADGAYVEISSVYDEATGKTSVKAVHATESAPLGDDAATIWQGAAQDWRLADNWSAGVPSSSKLAVFSECDGEKTVAAASGADAAAISFRADGYTLAGDGPVNISGRRGEAKIEVASDVSASVTAPLSLNTVTELSVAEGGRLSLAGSISDGSIEKTGSGSLTLEGEGDYFREVAFLGGMTTVKHPDALKGAPLVKLGGNATIAFSAESHLASPVAVSSTGDEPAIFKADADVTIGSLSVDGAFIKRGAAPLTVEVSSGKESRLTTADPNPAASLTYFPADGSQPAIKGWCGFTVAEGDVVLKGDGGEFKAPGTVLIGLNATNMSESAQARLVVDGAVLDNLTSVSKPLYIGYGTSLQYTRQFTPTLVVKNGGLVKTHTLYVGANTYGGSGNHPTLAVTNSVVYVASDFSITRVDAAFDNAAVTRTKDSRLLTGGNFNLQGCFDAEFDNTFVGKGSADGAPLPAPVKVRVNTYNVHMPRGTLAFRNGSVLSAYFENLSYPKQPIAFVWDDSEWRWAENLGDFTFTSSSVNPELFSFMMEGRGLILKPAAGAVFETEVPFTGPGGFVNAGAGTVRFGAGTFAFEGVCETAPGATVDLSGAGTLSGAKFGGAGTVEGAMLAGTTTIVLDAADDWAVEGVPFFKNCAFSGSVALDMGRSAGNPLSERLPHSLTVARFTGTAPDVSSWRLRAPTTGISSVFGVFVADAASGEVRMTVKPGGFTLFVR